jgi:hypothetical protein
MYHLRIKQLRPRIQLSAADKKYGKVGRTKLVGLLRNVECVRIAKYSYLSISLSTQHDNPLKHQL